MKSKIYPQVIAVSFGASGATVNIDTTTLKEYKKVVGIRFLPMETSGTAYVGTVLAEDLKIDGEIIKPKGFALENITSGINTPVSQRFWPLNLKAEGSRVEASITDGGNAAAWPYTAHLVLLLQKENDSE